MTRMTTTTDFSTQLWLKQPAHDVFQAISRVRDWWSQEIEGDTDRLQGIFLYHYRDVHRCKIKIVEYVPDSLVVWEVLENHFSFVDDKSEWVGNRMRFDITEEAGGTMLRFRQEGLVPRYACYQVCEEAWTNYIQNSLHNLITTGQGQPNLREGGYNTELARKWNLHA